MATASRTIKQHQVQISSDFSAWTTQSSIRCNECSEGAGQVVGSASLLRYIGTVREPTGTGNPAAQTPLTGLVGQWVRVLIEDPAGSITITSVVYAVLWYGIIDAERITDTGGGTGAQTWACAGLAAHLGRVTLGDGWTLAVDSSGATIVDFVKRIPTFNAPDDISASTVANSIDGVTCAVFDSIVSVSSGARWTAKSMLTMLLASHGRYCSTGGTFSGGLSFVLSAGTLLDFEAQTIDIGGMTLLDAVNALISPRRGLSWRLTVSGAVATINVRSISSVAITVGSTTLPAATDTATPTLTSLWAQNVELLEDQTSTYDVIQVIGARPWVTVSLAYDPNTGTTQAKSLDKGWTAGQETTWNTAPDSTTDGVWRSFTVGSTWDGRNYGTSTYGVRQLLAVSSGAYTGGVSFDSAESFPPTFMKLEAELPCGQGFTTLKIGPRQEPMAFWKPAGSSSWFDLQAAGSLTGRSIHVENNPSVIHLGHPDRSIYKANSQQSQNKFNLETSGVLVVTVGIREPNPLIVSYRRAIASWPRTNPRTLTVNMPSAEQWVILNGTIKGVTSGGALVTHGTEDMVRNDVPVMQSWLAFLQAYYANPARSLSWTDRGLIEYAYGSGAAAPAALVTTATLGTGSQTINAVVTRRTWNLTEDGYGTSYATERVVPDIESIR